MALNDLDVVYDDKAFGNIIDPTQWNANFKLIETITNANNVIVNGHLVNFVNPHQVTKIQVGLANVDDTSDVNKPISSLAQIALDTKLNKSGSKVINGVTTFEGDVYIKNNSNKGRIAFGTLGTLLQNSSDFTGLAINDKKIATQEYTDTALNLKVDKVTGKALSTNDYDNTEKASVASNTAARHSHANKATLDTYSQTEADLSDAVTKKHTHANKTVIDGILEVTTVLGSATNKVPSEKAVADAISFAGGGDMLKAVYDTTNNGIVDNSEKVSGFTVGKSVPANAVFTDTVTTVEDVLTSTSTVNALSAKQGKNLKDAADNLANIVSTKLAKFVGTTAGTGTVLTATISGATLSDFTNIQIRLHTDLGASATLNLNGLGAKPIYTSGNVAVGTGALTGSMLNLMYNSTLSRWYLLDILSVDAMPDGATVTPVGAYATWLACAGIADTFGSLVNVIASTTARDTLCNNLNALRYMVRSISTIMPAVLANSGWVTALDSSTYSSHTPTMTSATTPSGEAIGSYYGTYHPYKAFDKSTASYWVSPQGGISGKNIGYKFANSLYVYKMEIYAMPGVEVLKTATLQHSSDGSTWADVQVYTDLSTGTAETKTKMLSVGIPNTYWRLTNCTRYDADNYYNVSVYELDFYGLNLS